MPKPKRRVRKQSTPSTNGDSPGNSLVIYVHGIGDQPATDRLKREWDLALFGREMGDQTRMAYWSDILHSEKAVSVRRTQSIDDRNIDLNELLESAGVNPKNEDAQALGHALLRASGVQTAGTGIHSKVLPLPAFLRKPIARKFLQALLKDSFAYFFKPGIRQKVQQRLQELLSPEMEPVTIVAHSQGSIIALEVLAAFAKRKPIPVEHLITIGSPLGIREVQDFLDCPTRVPKGVERWHNFADPLDPVALDKGIANDFDADGVITDEMMLNTRVRRRDSFNPHSAVGYLSHPNVRKVVHDAARVDLHARFLMARDVAADMTVEERHPVLIEILEPGYPGVDETPDQARDHEEKQEKGDTSLSARVERAAERLKRIVVSRAGAHATQAQRRELVEAASIDPLRRFVAARLMPAELLDVAQQHRDLRIYSIWKSSAKRKLIDRSVRVIQADAAWASYGALGEGIRWAVLDTGVHRDHPHFQTHSNVIEVWDCTKQGPPTRKPDHRDRDGHGTHVSGIIAGITPESLKLKPIMRGVAPLAKLVVYQVLDHKGDGEDAWIIKALDHIAEQNENNSETFIHGVNLSLGGPYDSTVYGCGFSPICAELRRLWRSGALVVVACGNEGQVEVNTPDGELELNSPMSIGDPANLEDCIAVGSVNADRPHLYGVSAFSSHGPTSDGRIKPDVVAPGERIRSCNSRFRNMTIGQLYREDSGTSMAAPHVSGLLAAFLSVRKEFRGRPDEVKEILLRTCIDIKRDRYHQGHGIPNLMRMLLEA